VSAARICVWENNCHMGAASTSSKSGSKATKSARKKPAVKKAAAKKSTVKTPAAKKLTLQEQLTLVETRLKRANAVTRKNVKALDLLVNNLQADSKKTQTAQKAAFTRKINALNKKLSSMMEQSQSQISKDLSHAVSSRDIKTIKTALTSAEERLTLAEITQADALGKVNRHLANLATAIEARLDTERSDRNAAITASEAKFEKRVNQETAQLTQKIDGIETDTSAALDVLGEKIESFAEELDQRQRRVDNHMSAKMSEIALETQTEFEAFRSDIDQRINDFSSRAPANEGSNPDQSQLGEQVNLLQGRLDSLEQYLGSLQNQTALNTHAPQNPLYNQTYHNTQLAPAQTISSPTPAPSNVVPINDAFTPATSDLNPYSPPAASAEPEHPAKASHIPVEFDPAAYQNQTIAPNPHAHTPLQDSVAQAQTLNTLEASAASAYAPIIAQAVTTAPPIPAPEPELPPMGASGEHHPQPAPYASFEDLPPEALLTIDPQIADNNYVEPALPYADPAYAENEMRAERIDTPIGARDKSTGKAMPKLPLSGRNVKLLLMGSALAILMLVAGKVILGKQYTPIPQQSAQIESPAQDIFSENAAVENINQANETALKIDGPTQAPIGQYAENIVTDVTDNQLETLESAAASGNPIALYQLGMSNLKSGDIDKAVKFIRASAAQNLPAAQYRLAKLYEIGKGVTRDEAQARQLTERAAKSGHRVAMHDLALYFTDGRGGVDINVSTAKGWFEQAAKHGVVDSQFNLAVLAESGNPEQRDIETAYFWYNIAAKQGDQIAKKRAALITDGLSPEQIEAADARIAAFTPRPINSEANGIFKNVPWSPSSIQSVEIEQIRQAQSYLAELGYNVGAPDGAIGPNTQAAITAFEKASNLPETGTVSRTLLDQLKLEVGA